MEQTSENLISQTVYPFDKSGDNYDYGINGIYDFTTNDTTLGTRNETFNKPFFNNIFFNIKNGSYEITVMWCLLIITIVVLLSLLIKDADDKAETERVL